MQNRVVKNILEQISQHPRLYDDGALPLNYAHLGTASKLDLFAFFIRQGFDGERFQHLTIFFTFSTKEEFLFIPGARLLASILDKIKVIK